MNTARVRVGARILIARQDIGDEIARELQGLFDHKNPSYEKKVRMGIRFDHRKDPRVISTWRHEGPWLSLPRGGITRARALLRERGFGLRVRDERTLGYAPILEGFEWPQHRRTLYSDQEAAAATMIARETCCLRSPTASGKSTIGLAVIARLKLPAIVVVWTGSLFAQWRERIEAELGLEPRWIGEVQGKRKTIGAITVAMQQTVARIPAHDPFFGFFGVFLADETQRFGAPSFVASTDSFPARYRFGISADERRADRKDFLIYDLFGEVAESAGRLELVEKGRVRDVAIRIVPTAWRVPEDARTGNPGEQHRKMLDAMTFAEARDALVIAIAREELQRDEQILVFSLRVEHCRRLVGELASAGISAGLMLGGEENRQERDESIAGIRSGRMRVAVGTVQAVGTGLDLPRVGVGIATMPFANNRQVFGQVAGRLARIEGGVEPARLYCLFDEVREKDWHAYFVDDRPVYVRDEDGNWIDARKDKKRAKRILLPIRREPFGFEGGSDVTWRIR